MYVRESPPNNFNTQKLCKLTSVIFVAKIDTPICGHILLKFLNGKLHENPFWGYQLVTCVEREIKSYRVFAEKRIQFPQPS